MKNEGEGKREARLSRPLQVNRRPAPLGPSVYQSVQDVQRLSSDATGKKKKSNFLPGWKVVHWERCSLCHSIALIKWELNMSLLSRDFKVYISKKMKCSWQKNLFPADFLALSD